MKAWIITDANKKGFIGFDNKEQAEKLFKISVDIGEQNNEIKEVRFLTEKLQKLIEIVQDNGYLNTGWEPPSFRIDIDTDSTICGEKGAIEQIIFSHSFIKALYKAKYDHTAKIIANFDGAFHREVYDEEIKIETNRHLSELAISTNRIDYLWDNFGDAPSS